MPRQIYETRITADSLLVGKQVEGSPDETVWYMISSRDLFASVQALDTMGVYSRKKRPGHITQIRLQQEDVDAVERKVNERQTETTD